MSKHAVRYAFDMTVKASKVQDVHIHDRRRTFTTRLDESGAAKERGRTRKTTV